jgi:hypothetical protein
MLPQLVHVECRFACHYASCGFPCKIIHQPLGLIEELGHFSPRKLLLLLAVTLLMNTVREAVRQVSYLYNSLASGWSYTSVVSRRVFARATLEWRFSVFVPGKKWSKWIGRLFQDLFAVENEIAALGYFEFIAKILEVVQPGTYICKFDV